MPQLRTPCIIVSDAHLGVAPAEAEGTLRALMDVARREAKSLIINGDLFDFWFEWKTVMPRTGYRVLAAIAAVREAGVEVLWIAGNHDCWGGDVLREAGVTYHVGPWRGLIGEWRTLIEHGDGLRDVEDAPYRRLRAVLRNPVAIWAFRHLLHPDWASAIARKSSHTSRNMRPRDGGAGLERVARDRLLRDPSLDLYVYAHSHADQLAADERGKVFANAGPWMDRPRCLRVTDTHVELVDLVPGAGLRSVRSEERPRR